VWQVNNKIVIKTGSQQGDVYAFGIIMQELIQLSGPYGATSLTSKEIINKIRKPPPLLRPSVSKV
jgi:guanylate cyclase 2F